MWPFRRRTRALEDRAERAEALLGALREATQSETESPPRPARSLLRDFVYPDYVDQEALRALAVAKGIAIDPIEIDMSRSRTTGSSVSHEVGGGIRTPVSEVGFRTATEFSEGETLGESISTHRRQSMRWIVDQITGVLRAEGALQEDLAVVPEVCENEILLSRATDVATREWGLSEVDAEVVSSQREIIAASPQAETSERHVETTGETVEALPPPEGEHGAERQDLEEAERGTESGEDAEGGFDPQTLNAQNPTPRQLALALQIVSFAAADVIRFTVIRQVEALLASEQRTLFALVALEWGFWDEPASEAHLWNGGVVTPHERQQVTFGPPYIQVPIDKTKLNPLAQARYVHRQGFQSLQVFAKIERVQDQSIYLTPIVILSS
jgi:hypothetical protein